MTESGPRVGVWLVGARGSVATTALVGAVALRTTAVEPVGMVTSQPAFSGAGLPPVDALVFGGHDVASTPLTKRAERLAYGGVIPAHLLGAVHDDLCTTEAHLRAAPSFTHSGRAAEAVRADLDQFRSEHGLERVVVVNVASTEAPFAKLPEHETLDALDAALRDGSAVMPPSSVYAYAALSAGFAYVDFTPSTGARLPALDELAHRQRTCYAGNDGKTGETLLKSALAPVFAQRSLRVRSWAGTNLLGGGDGENLADPDVAASKVDSKHKVLEQTLGHPVPGPVHIDYLPDMGDWKTAWDHISFEGFLGVRMAMQFTWQGCDSTLAAPLVLDLARLVARAAEVGEVGPLPALAFFFKDPVATDIYALPAQYDELVRWAATLGERG